MTQAQFGLQRQVSAVSDRRSRWFISQKLFLLIKAQNNFVYMYRKLAIGKLHVHSGNSYSCVVFSTMLGDQLI